MNKASLNILVRQELTRGAIYDRNSRDNVSVILIVLNKWY